MRSEGVAAGGRKSCADTAGGGWVEPILFWRFFYVILLHLPALWSTSDPFAPQTKELKAQRATPKAPLEARAKNRTYNPT